MRIPKNSIGIACFVLMLAFFAVVGYKEWFANSPVLAQNIVEANSANTNDPGLKRAQVALQEFNKHVVESEPDCECGPEINLYTDNHPAQWCTMFASWVAKQAGSPVWSDKTKSWRISNSREFAEFLQKNGTWYSRDQVVSQHILPKPGDFIVTWRGDLEQRLGHVDIVIAVHDRTADVVGGNIGDRVVFRKDLPYMDDYGLLGFGRPEKP